ncbi:hypothetical protein BGZ89_002234 [Linnemannia elongata]|nr:hypothetical protein BGZ89_002234 [Linnemannia elongata]
MQTGAEETLEVLPKLGRRKVLVNGKPCGRNELIADFIYQETGKVRDRKQVSSHIQVLKNTRKNDPDFMKLLMDSGEGDEDMAPESTTNIGYLSSSQSPNATPQLQNDPFESTFFDSRGMQHHLSHDSSSPLSAHPHGQDGYGSYAEPLTTSSSAYYRQQQQQQFHESSSGVMDPTSSDHLYDDQMSVTTPDSAISLSSQNSVRDPTTFAMMDPLSREPLHLSDTHTPVTRQRDLFRSPPPPPMPQHYSQHSQQHSYPLWPTAFRLFTQYISAENKHHQFSPNDYNSPPTSGVQIHDLARLQDLNQNSFGTINIHHLLSEKFPQLLDLYQKVACEFLLFKISMNLDLELEGGTFENSCLFESNDPHRTVRCSTSIYSFGAKVLESTEIKQGNGSAVAMAGGGGMQKGGMGFQFVNQFFTAFLSGIRTLGTLDEVQVALSNLSIVQIYEEIDSVAVASGATAPGTSGVAGGGNSGENGGSPLLVMAFEFQQGGGSVVPYFVTEGSDMLDSLMC